MKGKKKHTLKKYSDFDTRSEWELYQNVLFLIGKENELYNITLLKFSQRLKKYIPENVEES